MSSNRSTAIPRWTIYGVFLACLFLLAGTVHWTELRANPQNSTSAPATSVKSPVPDLSGYWELKNSLRINGYNETPVMTPAAQARAEEQRAKAATGQVVSETSRYCRTLVYPFFMGSSPPFNIVQGPNEIMVIAEREMGSRHIFMDGRGHPDAAHLERTDNGDAIGHWEGDTLVVDTIGFKTGEMGGGSHGPNTHLVEHYKLIDGGKRLSVMFTWDDPENYAKPYSYERIYDRSLPTQYAMEDWCDASDTLQWRSDATPDLAPRKKSQ